jgi:hypothetical protein
MKTQVNQEHFPRMKICNGLPMLEGYGHVIDNDSKK